MWIGLIISAVNSTWHFKVLLRMFILYSFLDWVGRDFIFWTCYGMVSIVSCRFQTTTQSYTLSGENLAQSRFLSLLILLARIFVTLAHKIFSLRQLRQIFSAPKSLHLRYIILWNMRSIRENKDKEVLAKKIAGAGLENSSLIELDCYQELG